MATQAKKVIVVEVQADGAEDTIKKIQEAFDQTEEQAKKTEEALNDVGKSAGKTAEEVGKIKKQNLGTFTNEISGLVDKFKAGEIGVKGLATGVLQAGKAFTVAFISNPVGIAIAAITVAVLALYNLFKSFKPVVDKIEQAFAGLSAIFKVLKTTTIDLLSGNKSLKESFVGLGSSMADAATEAYNLKKAEQDLEDSALSLNVANAEAETQIQKLILQSKDRTKTEEERMKLIDDALELEKKQHEKNIEYADEAERIALRKMLVGQRLSDMEIENIRKGGIEALRDLQNKKDIADEDIENYANLLIQKQQLLQKSIAITEKAENTKAALDEKRAAEAQAAAEKRAAEKAKRDEEERARIEKQTQDNLDAQKRLEEALDAAHANDIERKKARENFDLEMFAAESERKRKENQDNISFYEREAFLAKTKEEKEAALIKLKEEKAKAEVNLEGFIITKKQDLLDKHYKEDKAQKEKLLENAKLSVEDRIKIDDELSALDAKYFEDKARLQNDLANVIDKIEEGVAQRYKERELAKYDAFVDATKDIIELETTKKDVILSSFAEIEEQAESAYIRGIIDYKEYSETITQIDKDRTEKLKEYNARRLEDAKQLVDTLSAIDKEATQTAINLQDQKLKNGKITQEQYDKNVEKIQEKAAKREKAYAVASAIINTAQGITKALSSSPPPMSFILAAAVGALGAAQIASILSTQVGSKTPPTLGGTGTGTGTGTETNTGTAPNTSFSFSEPIDQFPTKPTKSYVISKDVQSQQELDRRLVANGTI